MKSRVRNARWTRGLAGLRALAIKQPWAWLIVNGYKDIENRSWATRYRGPLLIHAGQSESDLDEAELAGIERKHHIKLPREFKRGGIVGVVDVVDCRARTKSPWHIRGNIGWVLSNPAACRFGPARAR